MNPQAITALTTTYEVGEVYVARLMVPAVLVGLWEMWRYNLDPTHISRQPQAHLQGVPVQFVGR